MGHAQGFCVGGQAAAVGTHDEIIQFIEGYICRGKIAAFLFTGWVVVPHVCAGGAQMPGFEGIIQGVLVDDGTTPDIDQDAALRHGSDFCLTNEVFCFGGGGQDDDEHICAGQELLQFIRTMNFKAVFNAFFRVAAGWRGRSYP